MQNSVKSMTPRQDRVAEQAAKANRINELANRPGIPWWVCKLANLEARRQRPTRIEERIARWTDGFVARSEASYQASRERSQGRLQEALGEFSRMKAGEPEPEAQCADELAVDHSQDHSS